MSSSELVSWSVMQLSALLGDAAEGTQKALGNAELSWDREVMLRLPVPGQVRVGGAFKRRVSRR